MPHRLDEVAFLDVEASRGGDAIAVGVVLGMRELRLQANNERERRRLAEAIAEFVRDAPLGGHNITRFDLPLLAAAPVGYEPSRRPVLDTLVLSMLADPGRPSHALDKSPHAGTVPDPVDDARQALALALTCRDAIAAIEPALGALYAAMLRRADHEGAAIFVEHAIVAEQAADEDALLNALPESALARVCRIRLAPLMQTLAPERPLESLAFALALRFIECCSADNSAIDDRDPPREARLRMPPSSALAVLPRFSELLVRLLGPLCPDLGCVHRARCDVHRPLAEEILARNFELRAFRPHQEDIVRAVLEGRTPLAILPTGGGKSLCYQLPAVHGAQRLHGLTVVVSPLQALMADQVRSLSTRFPGVATINASLLMQERSEVLAGVRTGRYDIVYLGPEQLRNPGIVRLFANAVDRRPNLDVELTPFARVM